jgi:hypothetical protein
MSNESGSEQPDELLGTELCQRLEKEHGEILAIKTRAGVAAFKVFSKGDYDRYTDLLMKEGTRAKAFSHIVFASRIHPEAQVFMGWVDKYPGIITTCANPVLEFGGVDTEATTKKYGSA